MQDRYDTAFLGILQNEGEISKFLDCFFSFLYRKTDFYVLLNSPSDRMGFPPGIARKLVLSAFERYSAMATNDQRKKCMQKETVSHTEPSTREERVKVPEVSRTEEVTTEPPPASFSDKDSSKCENQMSALPSNCDNVCMEETVMITSESISMDTVTADTTAISSAMSAEQFTDSDRNKDSVMGRNSDVAKTLDENDDPEQTRLQKIFQANPESYNGAIRDKYLWSQSITDVDVRVKVPKHARKGKDVIVEIGKKHLKVSCKDINGQLISVIDGDLVWECHKEECIWSLVPGEYIHVNLDKVEERWWDALLTDEPKINVRKIDPSRPMTDLDDEAQAKIEEMMYNEQQKRLGLPQSHEKKVHEMLAKAWDAEGSPFKGQPFDPSKFNVSPNGLT